MEQINLETSKNVEQSRNNQTTLKAISEQAKYQKQSAGKEVKAYTGQLRAELQGKN